MHDDTTTLVTPPSIEVKPTKKPKLTSMQLQSAGMPNDDGRASMWLEGFAHNLVTQRELWPLIGVTQESSDRITALAKAFSKAVLLAHGYDTGTAPNIRAKTLARNEAVAAVREVVNAAKANPNLMPAQLVALNIIPKIGRDRRRKQAKDRIRRMFDAGGGERDRNSGLLVSGSGGPGQ